MSRALTWCWRHERMPGKKILSFLCTTTQIVCPLRCGFDTTQRWKCLFLL